MCRSIIAGPNGDTLRAVGSTQLNAMKRAVVPQLRRLINKDVLIPAFGFDDAQILFNSSFRVIVVENMIGDN
jgi:hypothetical protein